MKSNAPETEDFTWRPKRSLENYRLAVEEPQVVHPALDTKPSRVFNSGQGPQPLPTALPPKMYMPSAASDQPAVWYSRAEGGVPVGLICCQELPYRAGL